MRIRECRWNVLCAANLVAQTIPKAQSGKSQMTMQRAPMAEPDVIFAPLRHRAFRGEL